MHCARQYLRVCFDSLADTRGHREVILVLRRENATLSSCWIFESPEYQRASPVFSVTAVIDRKWDVWLKHTLAGIADAATGALREQPMTRVVIPCYKAHGPSIHIDSNIPPCAFDLRIRVVSDSIGLEKYRSAETEIFSRIRRPL